MFPDELHDFLDGIQRFMTGREFTDNDFYDKLEACIKKTDDRLLDSVNAQWIGLKGYANNQGNPPSDHWYPCDSEIKPGQVSF